MQFVHAGMPGSQRGVALVVVLWLVLLLSLLAAAHVFGMRTEARLTAHRVHAAQARGLAEAGVWLAVDGLLAPANAADGAADPAHAHEHALGAGRIRIEVQDESGRVDLNYARPAALDALLRGAGVAEGRRVALVDAILDWRDPDDAPRPAGAEADAYRHAGFAYGPKNGPFNSVDELRLVHGMTDPVYRRLVPALTVHGRRADVDPRRAAPEVRRLIDAGAGVAAAGEGDEGANRPTGRRGGPGSGSVYAITSEGEAGGAAVRLTAVVALRRGGAPPYTVLSWREGMPRARGLRDEDP